MNFACCIIIPYSFNLINQKYLSHFLNFRGAITFVTSTLAVLMIKYIIRYQCTLWVAIVSETVYCNRYDWSIYCLFHKTLLSTHSLHAFLEVHVVHVPCLKHWYILLLQWSCKDVLWSKRSCSKTTVDFAKTHSAYIECCCKVRDKVTQTKLRVSFNCTTRGTCNWLCACILEKLWFIWQISKIGKTSKNLGNRLQINSSSIAKISFLLPICKLLLTWKILFIVEIIDFELWRMLHTLSGTLKTWASLQKVIPVKFVGN